MAIEIKVPSPGESITEVIIDNFQVADGDFVAKDTLIAEIQSDKAMLEIYAEESGVVRLKAAAGDTVAVGAVIAVIEPGAGAGTASKPSTVAATPAAAAPAAPAGGSGSSYAQGLPSPSAQRVMDAKGLQAGDVQGTGRDGRITKADALSAQPAAKAAPAAPATPAVSASATPAAPSGSFSRVQERKKLSALRQTLSKRLVSVKNETAMLTTFNEIDMSAAMAARSKYKDSFEKRHGIRLGFMGFFAAAVSKALMEFPEVNAYIDGNEIVYNNYVDLGIAVSSDRGLMVPVIRNSESLSLWEIEAEVGRLAKKARDGKITIDDMTGGTYTITNGGVFGSLMSTPILNPPQSAILGMHKIEDRPVVVGGQIVIRPMMYVAMSYDHRIIDGKESVSFLVRVKEYVEDPVRLLLGA